MHMMHTSNEIVVTANQEKRCAVLIIDDSVACSELGPLMNPSPHRQMFLNVEEFQGKQFRHASRNGVTLIDGKNKIFGSA